MRRGYRGKKGKWALGTVGIGLLLIYWHHAFIIYCLLTYPPHIIRLISQEPSRRLNRDNLMADQFWQLYRTESQHYQDQCQAQGTTCPEKFTWLTAMVNDQYVIPAIVLGHGLRKFSCCHRMLALVTANVSHHSRKALQAVGFSILQVQHLDCQYLHHRNKRKLPKYSGILGTHTRFHAWKLINYSRIVYLDPDFLLLGNFDSFLTLSTNKELMAAYCARPGIIDPCFNAGLLVIQPSIKIFNDLIALWNSFYSWKCLDDQVLMYQYFAKRYQWDPLPYSYNVRRMVYFPIKAYHFACCKYKKPWKLPQPSRPIILGRKNLLSSIDGIMQLWWYEFYQALDQYKLNRWWSNYLSSKTLSSP
ncbi:uncharacterized protein TRIADDRAFT_53929 [Trichoplax adhaerens]|uniref:glycogenin glucosyltransferase n=1 Tax=Trichoplax adhaerens TaxID=10228 RepID=B3RME8_TRIAD|nr:hypothetical protein TRIADDRAFT_53929 [Trichoplax adhaerens]EDV28354.1 hypothetical protein TRIADDRAFT_53929 [Trichoplax adhaerens]|eukprot:XP_002110188.1 hypothetical protein TRIADDRAFT_53929 [Trichoplax adhaerens]